MSYREAENQFLAAMCLNTAIQLAIPDKVSNHGRPITLPELAKVLHLHPTRTAALNQIMRFLVFKGLFSIATVNEEDAYVLAPSSHTLLRDIHTTINSALSSPPSVMGPFELFYYDFLKVWRNLGNWFLSDEPTTPFKFVHGISFWEYVNGSPDRRIFHQVSETNAKMFTESSDFKTCLAAVRGLESVVDVGGGTGSLAKAISESYPNMKCTVLDLPEVVDNVPQPTQSNVSFVGGDMFQCIPPADAVIMQWIMHNWPDDKCALILKNCKDAIENNGKKGKLIIIEAILEQEEEGEELASIKFGVGLHMMLLFNGKERTEKEWKKLTMAAGFSHYKITPLSDIKSVMEVFP